MSFLLCGEGMCCLLVYDIEVSHGNKNRHEER